MEICVAEVGATAEKDELYRLTYDGSVQDEPGFMAMGGQAEAIGNVLRAQHSEGHTLKDALKLAVAALSSIGGENGASRTIVANQLEVAILDRARTGRTFRRLTGNALTAVMPEAAPSKEDKAEDEGGKKDGEAAQ